jgi:hypothetical protein
MADLHIFVGDTTVELSHHALQYDSSAYLVTSSNQDKSHKGTIYTSLGDLASIDQFFRLLFTASSITYCPPKKWSDSKNSTNHFSLAWFTEYCIGIAINLNNIKFNGPLLSVISIPAPKQQRKTNSAQLWVAGCSTTFGQGVGDDEKYASILSRTLNLPLSLLADIGSSICWACDQILRSDIRNNDLVVLGLTSSTRITILDNNQVVHSGLATFMSHSKQYPELNIHRLQSNTKIYEDLCAVTQVINFCNKIGAKLVILGLHAELPVSAELAKYKNFIFHNGKFGYKFRDNCLDTGTDGIHPGPKSHQLYADLIIAKIKEL